VSAHIFYLTEQAHLKERVFTCFLNILWQPFAHMAEY